MTMRAFLFACALLPVLAACASETPRCGGRLMPINRQSIRSDDPAGGGRAALHSPAKAPHS